MGHGITADMDLPEAFVTNVSPHFFTVKIIIWQESEFTFKCICPDA